MKAQVMTIAHEMAKATVSKFNSYREAFKKALKNAWAKARAKVLQVETGLYKKGNGCTYKQADYLTDLLGYMPFPSLTQVQRKLSFKDACDIIDACKAGYTVEFI